MNRCSTLVSETSNFQFMTKRVYTLLRLTRNTIILGFLCVLSKKSNFLYLYDPKSLMLFEKNAINLIWTHISLTKSIICRPTCTIIRDSVPFVYSGPKTNGTENGPLDKVWHNAPSYGPFRLTWTTHLLRLTSNSSDSVNLQLQPQDLSFLTRSFSRGLLNIFRKNSATTHLTHLIFETFIPFLDNSSTLDTFQTSRVCPDPPWTHGQPTSPFRNNATCKPCKSFLNLPSVESSLQSDKDLLFEDTLTEIGSNFCLEFSYFSLNSIKLSDVFLGVSN